jgi:twitching motility protein PilT
VTLQELLQTLVNKRGSDLHVRSGGPAYVRVDGELSQVSPDPIPTSDVETMLMQVASARAKKIYEERGECDFSFQAGDVARFRVNAFRQRQKLCLAVRYISTTIPTLADLRLPVATLKKIADNNRGLVLVTGITGSGKSSTLAAMIDYINDNRAEHVLTIEDPVEFVHRDKKAIITQREIGEDTQNYSDGLKMAMRQDPDVILIGEMRDLETIQLAITAAETGHLCFGTLHTQDSPSTIDRIIDVFPPHQQTQVRVQLATVLQAVVCQQLVPRKDGEGRIAAREVMITLPAISNLIREGKTHMLYQAIDTGAKHGMISMDKALAELVRQGLVHPDEALTRASNPETFKQLAGITGKAGSSLM